MAEWRVMTRAWIGVLAAACLWGGCKDATPPPAPAPPPSAAAEEGKALFDGKTLTGFTVPKFGGEGEVRVEDGQILLEMGHTLTGVTWSGEVPKIDYEVSLEARKIEGSDFFCAIAFPRGEDFCSFVAGGWGGGVVGLSSIDSNPAIDNETMKVVSFEKGRWYRLRVRVTAPKIEAWIDNEQVVDFETADKHISLHPAMELSKPLGFASYQTTSALRNIRLRKLR